MIGSPQVHGPGVGKAVQKTVNSIENGNSPEYAKEQVPEGLSRLPIRDLTLSTSYWLRPPDLVALLHFVIL